MVAYIHYGSLTLSVSAGEMPHRTEISDDLVELKPGYTYGLASKSVSTLPPGTPGAYIYVSHMHQSLLAFTSLTDLELSSLVSGVISR